MGLRPLQLPVQAGGVQELLGLQRRASRGEEGEGGGGAAVADGPPGEWATVGKKQRNFTQRGDEELSVRPPPILPVTPPLHPLLPHLQHVSAGHRALAARRKTGSLPRLHGRSDFNYLFLTKSNKQKVQENP